MGKGDQAFDGNTVYTLKNNKPNKILKVSDESLKRDSENDSPTQTIPKEVFKIVYNHVIEKGQITRVEINAALPHRYSSIGYNGDIDPSAGHTDPSIKDFFSPTDDLTILLLFS